MVVSVAHQAASPNQAAAKRESVNSPSWHPPVVKKSRQPLVFFNSNNRETLPKDAVASAGPQEKKGLFGRGSSMKVRTIPPSHAVQGLSTDSRFDPRLLLRAFNPNLRLRRCRRLNALPAASSPWYPIPDNPLCSLISARPKHLFGSHAQPHQCGVQCCADKGSSVADLSVALRWDIQVKTVEEARKAAQLSPPSPEPHPKPAVAPFTASQAASAALSLSSRAYQSGIELDAFPGRTGPVKLHVLPKGI